MKQIFSVTRLLAKIVAAILLIQTSVLGADVRYGLYIKEDNEGRDFNEDGRVAGTTGRSWQTDAFWLQTCPFPIEFRCHFAKIGWGGWTKLGEWSTSVGKQLEALEFRFPKGDPESFGYVMMGRAHCAGAGWMEPVRIRNGAVLGTTGQSARLEAIQLGVEKIVP